MMSARLVIKDRGSGKTMWEEDGRNKGENRRMEKNTQVNLGEMKGGKIVASMRSLPTVLLTCRDPLQYWS